MKKSILSTAKILIVLLGFSCSNVFSYDYLKTENDAVKDKEKYVIYKPSYDVPERLQWHQNYGYCWETSFISIGLGLGQYTSQYKMRHLTHPHLQQSDPKSQLLLGVSRTEDIADKVHYKHSEYSECTSEAKNFLKWIKTQLYKGHGVIIGVYLNENLFYKHQNSKETLCNYGKKKSSCLKEQSCVPNKDGQGFCEYGDPEYDHIVIVASLATKKPCMDINSCEYDDEDIITISDHGLYSSECEYGNESMGCPGEQLKLCEQDFTSKYKYLYSYKFKDFLKSRKEANQIDGPVYSLSNMSYSGQNCLGNYGIAIHGLKGNSELLPITVKVSKNFECDMIQEGTSSYYNVSGGSVRHDPIDLQVTVSGMEKGKKYNLYQYKKFKKVPDEAFNANSENLVAEGKAKKWVIESASGSITIIIKIKDNETAIFRAVAVDAK